MTYTLIQVFDVKNDVVNTLAMPVTARYIQIKALEPKGYPSNVVKATFYGCIITGKEAISYK